MEGYAQRQFVGIDVDSWVCADLHYHDGSPVAWSRHRCTLAFFLEYDTGTEAHHVLSAKLARYSAHIARGGSAWPVLFVVHSRHREEHLQENLHGAYDAPIATATMERLSASGPAQAVWTVPGLDHQPKSLIDLVR